MSYNLSWQGELKKVAIFVSKYDHVLWELLLRHRAGELPCEISVIVSNHEDLRPIADMFGIRFEVFKITKETKVEQELAEISLLRSLGVSLIVLARYMQIVSDNFCTIFHHQVINIHHSFLPAFIGSKPYHRAHERGVKLIGATAHYATADLDEGPIIEQDITRISHIDGVQDLIAKGRLLEKSVLVRAVKKHLEELIIVEGNKCVVFGD
jgi:formyltetrahydrofolate deformylase